MFTRANSVRRHQRRTWFSSHGTRTQHNSSLHSWITVSSTCGLVVGREHYMSILIWPKHGTFFSERTNHLSRQDCSNTESPAFVFTLASNSAKSWPTKRRRKELLPGKRRQVGTTTNTYTLCSKLKMIRHGLVAFGMARN